MSQKGPPTVTSLQAFQAVIKTHHGLTIAAMAVLGTGVILVSAAALSQLDCGLGTEEEKENKLYANIAIKGVAGLAIVGAVVLLVVSTAQHKDRLKLVDNMNTKLLAAQQGIVNKSGLKAFNITEGRLNALFPDFKRTITPQLSAIYSIGVAANSMTIIFVLAGVVASLLKVFCTPPDVGGGEECAKACAQVSYVYGGMYIALAICLMLLVVYLVYAVGKNAYDVQSEYGKKIQVFETMLNKEGGSVDVGSTGALAPTLRRQQGQRDLGTTTASTD